MVGGRGIGLSAREEPWTWCRSGGEAGASCSASFRADSVFAVYHRLARRRFVDYGRRTLGVDFRSVDPGPAAPKELIARTSASNDRQLELEANPDKYLGGGYRMVLNWLKVLEHFSFNIRTIGAILEFGCGAARLIRHFRCMDGVQLVGTDLNPDMIE